MKSLKAVLRLPHATGPAVAVVASLLGLSWLIVNASGGANTVPPHMVYVPVFIAGWRLGAGAAVAAAVVGGILTGPLLPADVSGGEAQPVSDWTVRLAFFVGIGVFMAVLMQRWKADAALGVQAERRAHDLAVREKVFLESASHEIRTPLTVIMGVTRTLEQRAMILEEARDLLESLRRATGRLDRLCTMALASVGAANEADPELTVVVDLRDLVTELATELETVGAPDRIIVDMSRDAARLRTEPRLFRPALGALIENALKFSPPSAPIEISSRRVNDRIAISVRDFGPGIEPEFVEQAFDPFTRADESLRREHEGLGIGLFAARRLIERLEGEIGIVDHQGRGVEAVILLPAWAVSEPPKEPQRRSTA